MSRHAEQTSAAPLKDLAPVAGFESYSSLRMPQLNSRKGRAHLSYYL